MMRVVWHKYVWYVTTFDAYGVIRLVMRMVLIRLVLRICCVRVRPQRGLCIVYSVGGGFTWVGG